MKSVLITGANRGIGLALAKSYTECGWQVTATYRDIKHAGELTALAEKHSNLHCIPLEITDYSQFSSLSEQLGPLDMLINNAGYYGPTGYGFGNTDEQEWRKVFEINTIAPLKLAEALYSNLLEHPTRKIACLSSKVGSMAENTSGGGYIYRSSKAALNSVVKSLSNDLSQQGFISVALHPGWVLTKMGGPNALISTEVSAAGLVNVIEGLKPEDSGRFLNYDGTDIPW